MAVVRQDVVQINFDIDMGEITKLTDELDSIKKSVDSGIGDDAFDELVKDTKKATDGLDDVKDSIKGINPDGIDKTADGLKDTDKQAGKAHSELKKMAKIGFDKTLSGLKKMGTALGKVAIAAGKALLKSMALAATGVGVMVTQAVKSYAEYEQLVGGVETLFGDSSDTVQEYAKNAYKTAGLSANDYMDTVTSFSASLIKSLGGDTAKAAEYGQMAIVDMSDNANKMGSDMGSIQDAYQGFAKQNYTMLDNLKLGYGGTQEEMKRLLQDAGKIAGKKFDLSNYADIVEAIHIIQTEMGIAGTTSLEAEDTISGSLASLKSAWANTLTSLVVGGDSFDECVDNLVESAKTFGKNIMPAITKALEGVGSLIEELAPIIEAELPNIIETLLPPLIKAATSLIKGLIIALPGIIEALIKEIPYVLREIGAAIGEAFGDIPGFGKVEDYFGKLASFFKKNAKTIKKFIPVIIGLVAAFKLFKKLKFLGGMFGKGTGGTGGGIFDGFKNLGKMNTGTVLKGMLNLAIILGGLTILAAAIMYVAPYMAQLSDLKSLVETIAVIGAVGLLGAGLSKLAGYVGNIPVATVAKGLANIAIALVGIGALAALLMWVAPYIAGLADLQTIFKLLLIIGAVGLVGSALAALAGIIGIIPIPAVLAGLANIALALGGVTAIVVAFGALSQIDGFNEFLSSGGETLATIFNVIGECAGSLIGGLGEGITASLPAIGDNLSSFATSIQPMFTTFAGVDTGGFNDFLLAFSAFVAVMTGEKILSFITGGIDYAGQGTQLTSFATNAAGFFTAVAAIPEAAFTNTTKLFNCLSGVNGLPKDGGLVQWFTGTIDYDALATGLTKLTGVSDFFTMVSEIPEAAFTGVTNFFNCLSGVGALPKDGGIAQWFTGSIDYDALAAGLTTLTSESMVTALTTIADLPPNVFSSLSSMFSTLAGITALPTEGGIFGWFTGDASKGLSNVAEQLPEVATNISSFFSNIGGRTDFTPIASLFNTLGTISIDDSAADKGFLGWGTSKFESIGTGLSSFAKNAGTFFDTIDGMDTSKIDTFFTAVENAGGIPEALDGIDGDLGTTLSNMATTITTGMTQVQALLASALATMIATCSAKYSAFFASGAYMMTGLKMGMMSKLPDLVSTASAMAAAIQSAFDVKMDINSPSKVMDAKGVYTGQGLVNGMERTIPSIKNAAVDMGTAATFDTYSPSASNVTNNNVRDSEVTNVSPVFNLNISGSQDDRALARKVKQYVSDAIKETLESLDRKSVPIREV